MNSFAGNENENTIYKDVWDIAKAELRKEDTHIIK